MASGARLTTADPDPADGKAGPNVALPAARLRLFGGFQLQPADGGDLVLSNRRGNGLIAYLYLEPDQRARRERLCGLLWSDRGEAQARGSLRQCLFDLKRTLPAPLAGLLLVDREWVGLAKGALGSDVAELRRALADDDAHAAAAIVERFGRGRLLDDLELGGLYGDWLEQTRTQIDQTLAAAVQASLARLTDKLQWNGARALADAWLQRDPLDEAVAAIAIRADAAAGAPAAAQRRFQLLRTELDKAFGVEPGPAVVEALEWAGRAEARPSRPAQEPPAQLEGAAARPLARPVSPERRRLTVLACNLVDPGQLAERLDPEQLHQIAAQFQQAASDIVAPMEGRIARRLPDGLIIYFGFPEASENAAERAARAGLAIIEAMDEINVRLGVDRDAGLRVRAGVHSGAVVVAAGGDDEFDVFGDAVSLAIAAQSHAGPGRLAVTGAVHELISGLFLVEDLGPHALNGGGQPTPLFRIVRPALVGVATRGFAPGRRSPLVGRGEELRQLTERWGRVKAGEGQYVQVTGEPGIGKSRLLEAFRDAIRADPHLWFECAGAQLYANTPYRPITQMLQQGLGWMADDDPAHRVRRLEQALRASSARLEEAVPLIAELLGLPIPAKYPPLKLAPAERRQRLMAALIAWVFSASRGQPLVVVMDDLQWVDPSTMELMQQLVDQGSAATMMLVGLARPEFRPPWSPREHHLQLRLSRLGDDEIRTMVESLVASGGGDAGVVDTVIARTDGVPLFAEELTRLVLETAGGPGASDIPGTLVDSLAVRLDRLGPAKPVAQLASVLGRQFDHDLIAAVSELPRSELDEALGALVRSDLVFARGLPPQATYRFKHALIRDAAYRSLLKSRRRELHARTAEAIAERFPLIARTEPELLAHHWTEAGRTGPAIVAWMAARDDAIARRAFVEAEEACRRALALAVTLPAGPDRDARELELCIALSRVLQLTHGYAAAPTVEATARAKALAEKTGSTSAMIREEARAWRGVIAAGDYAGAAAMADHIVRVAQEEADRLSDAALAVGHPPRLVFGHSAQLQSRFYTGDLAGAEANFSWLSPNIEAARARQDPGDGAITLGVAGWAAWLAGRAATAHERIGRAYGLAEASGNPYDLARALHFQGILATMEHDAATAEKVAARLLELARDNGFAYAGELARISLGWALAERGAADVGVGHLQHYAQGQAHTGARVGLTYGLTLLAAAQARAGDLPAARLTLEEALEANLQERVFRPESLRLRGELKRLGGDAVAAEADLAQAIELAREIGATAWELRAASSLARLRDAQGAGGGEALVAAVRARFSEAPSEWDSAVSD